jgi:hypothetical protein
MSGRRFTVAAAIALIGAACIPGSAHGFGLLSTDTTVIDSSGASSLLQAGSHPLAMTVSSAVVTETEAGSGKVIPAGQIKDLKLSLPPGLVGKPTAVPRCGAADFLGPRGDLGGKPSCAPATQVGIAKVEFGEPGHFVFEPVYNLEPAPGSVAKLGFAVLGRAQVVVDLSLNPEPPHNVIAEVGNLAQALFYFSSEVTIWGVPASPVHDDERSNCSGTCAVDIPEEPFLRLPTRCGEPLITGFEVDSWQQPGAWLSYAAASHDDSVPPNPLALSGCSRLGFAPGISAQPTTRAASSPSGLDFSADVKDEGLTNPTGIGDSDVKKAVVTLPEGFTTNPSLAEGLSVCTREDLRRETATSTAGAGCPNASKVGTVEVETPLLEDSMDGAVYVAEPYENPFGSLLALYVVIKNPRLGISVKLPLRVEADPLTGRLTTTADDLPQLPFSHFKLHFREGARSPLASPPACGAYNAEAVFTPWSGGAAAVAGATFPIIAGPAAGPCPAGAARPFHPDLVAGTLNNAAGSYSPFNMRLTRSDGEQEFTRFSVKLPPGLVGKLAGIPFCPDASIAAAKARTGPHGGLEELRSPSCPAASAVGRTLVGAGVGPVLAYAPGKVYLAGPYHGSSLSIAAITAAKVGPFDLGTVVVREALKINPRTAEVFVDPTGSDPIPHIIKGIPVHARDIRVYVDRHDFILNPTNCKRTSIASTVLGSGANFGSDADDQPVTVTSPFQTANCDSLRFRPKLALSLKGGTDRGDTPKLKAVLTARKGDANIGRAQVTLPHSEFLEQAHIRTICTRVQFAAGAGNGAECPPASIYGHAKAITPLLDEPIRGPVYLRSSSHNLPDMVAALHSGKIDINLVGRIDSVKSGRIRSTFEALPDAPVRKFILTMQGGRKGLLVNSTDICREQHRALVAFTGQNGKVQKLRPPLRASCGKRAGK